MMWRKRGTRRGACVLLWPAVLACATPSEPASAVDAEPDAPAASYQFGAKFEPPTGRVVHAVGQWEAYNAKYLALLPPAHHPAARLIFVDIGDTPRGWQPDNIAALLAQHDAKGVIPHIDIALRGLQPTKAELDQLPDPLYGIDDEVAGTTKYDGRIQDLIAIARAYRKPLMMRIGGEFSGWWNGYHPWEFPKAFRKIVTMFRQAGADNVAFIWCYEPAAPGDFAERNAAGEWKWYPGADVVDWFSIDWFDSSDISAAEPGARAPASYDQTIAFLDMAVAEHKPVIVAESAPARWTKASYYAANGWKNNDLAASPALAQRYAAEIANARYLHAGEKSLLKDYERYR